MRTTALITASALAAGFLAADAAEAWETPPAPDCSAARSSPSGHHSLRLEMDGMTRDVALVVPRSYDGTLPVPLVLDLHASSITPEVELAVTRLDAAAEEQGFLLALPHAVRPFEKGGTTWNLPRDRAWPDDVAFIGAVIDTLEESYCIDADRIYATGYSGGARLASELACRMSDRIAAISAIGGLRGPEPGCPPAAGSVAVLGIHGLADPVNPYDGDPARSPEYWDHGVREAVERWSARLGCDAALEASVAGGVTRLDLTGCAGALTLYSLEALGHTWPGSPFAFPDYTGATDTSIDATQLTLDWFARHPRRRSSAASQAARR